MKHTTNALTELLFKEIEDLHAGKTDKKHLDATVKASRGIMNIYGKKLSTIRLEHNINKGKSESEQINIAKLLEKDIAI